MNKTLDDLEQISISHDHLTMHILEDELPCEDCWKLIKSNLTQTELLLANDPYSRLVGEKWNEQDT